MRRQWIVRGLAALALAALVAAGLAVRALAAIGAGYSAKILCSCVFVAERDPDSCRTQELGGYGFVDVTVDRSARATEARAFWIGHARAEHLGTLGCTLE